MSPLLRRRGAETGLPERMAAVEEILGRAGTQLDPGLRQRAETVLGRADERLRLSADATVVALAGATGSGKSSLFNALAGEELARVGVRRPVTSQAQACVWAEDDGHAAALLDWLGVARRSLRAPGSRSGDGEPDLEGLVLLDLPDFDSTAADHRLQADRLVTMVDLLVWVVDPQKYADAVLHERYLRPLRSHAEVSVVVLNQIDRLPGGAVRDCLAHLRQLLDDDGLGDAPLLATSAATGEGVDRLRTLLGEAVQARRSAQARIAADVDELVAALDAVLGGLAPADGRPAVRQPERDELVDALVAAAGGEVVAAAVERSWRARTIQATGLPWTRWTGRLRPDPLRRLHLGGEPVVGGARGDGRSQEALADTVASTIRSSLPTPTPVQRARVDSAVRRVADRASERLPQAWVESVRAAARSRSADLADALDRAVVGTDLGVDHRPAWWRVVGGVQVVLAAAVLVGVLWLGAVAVVAWLGLPDLPAVTVGPRTEAGDRLLPLPTALLLGGLLLGVVVAMLARFAGATGGRRRRRRAERRLRSRIAAVADELVIAPVAEQLEDHAAVAGALERARR